MSKVTSRHLLLGALLSGLPLIAPAGPEPQATISGVLSLVWEDDMARGRAVPRWFLTTRAGLLVELDLASLEARGQAAAVQGQWVTARGAPLSARRHRVDGLAGGAALNRTPMPGPPAIGPAKWLVVLCRFKGEAPYITSDALLARFGDSENSLGHYFREVSGDRFVLGETVGKGWFELPGTHSEYGGNASFQLGRLTEDCLAAVDPEVFLPEYDGILIQTTNGLGATGLGGALNLALDGQQKRYGMSWMSGPLLPIEDQLGVYAHEIGHALGLAHSKAAPTGTEYGSTFDVMSGSRLVHPIAYQKDNLGWIPRDRILTLGTVDQGRRVGVGRLGLPATAEPLLVRVPMGPRTYYSIEFRQAAGYDRNLPRTGVVIHRVSRDRGVVDALLVDSNDDPDDGGVGWSPGQTFRDVPAGVTVSVDSVVGTVAWITASAPANAPRVFDLTVITEGPGMVREVGSAPNLVCSGTCVQQFVEGDQVRIERDPGAGAMFQGWSGDCEGDDLCLVAVDGPKTVRAAFALGSTIETEVTGRGVVTSLPVGILCSPSRVQALCAATFARSSALTLQASRDSGAYFAGFTAPCGAGPACTFAVGDPTTLRASFQDGPSLRVRVVGDGFVASDTVGGGWIRCLPDAPNDPDCNSGFAVGAVPTLRALPFQNGSQFVSWTGPCIGLGPCRVTMATPQRVGAVFAREILLWTEDSVRRREVPFRAAAGGTDSVRVVLGGPGSSTWQATSTGRFATISEALGPPFGWVRWSRQTAPLLPGWQVDTLRIAATGAPQAAVAMLDSLRVVAEATFAGGRTGRADSLVERDPDPRRDSVAVPLAGRDAALVPWRSSAPAFRMVATSSGTGPGWLVWERAAGTLVPGRHLDSIVVLAEGAVGVPLVVVDTLVIVEPPGRTAAALALLGGAPVQASQARWLDGLGNRDGQYNLGDFLALVDRAGGLATASR